MQFRVYIFDCYSIVHILSPPHYGDILNIIPWQYLIYFQFQSHSILLLNTNPFGFSRIEIAAGAETAEGTIVGISETVIHDIVPFEQRAFTVIIPSVSVAAKEVAKTELFIEPFR